MVIAVFAKTLGRLQHLTQLIPENKSYTVKLRTVTKNEGIWESESKILPEIPNVSYFMWRISRFKVWSGLHD
jgi:hypothetical protein